MTLEYLEAKRQKLLDAMAFGVCPKMTAYQKTKLAWIERHIALMKKAV